ncbi:MAG: lipid II:glycine glycyltransferase FemX [Patescibacteria group bacterium]
MNPYFNQTLEWKNFFLDANDEHHHVYEVKLDSISLFIYEYPLIRGLKFWYVPRTFLEIDDDNPEEYEKYIKLVFEEIKKRAKNNNVIFFSFDIDPRLITKLNKNYETKQDIEQLVNLNLKNPFKKIQYSSTPILPVDDLIGTGEESVEDFFKINEKGFFLRTNKTCRNLTRRSLEKGWSCNFTDSEEDFEEFWKIWQDTAKRQNFNLHPKSYITKLLKSHFAKLAVIKDSEGIIQGGWVLIHIKNSVTNIFGANSSKSLEQGGQYYFHVFALKYIQQLKNKGESIDFYDLGGADEDGYGNFKKSYKPDYLNFVGQFDHVINPFVYHSIKMIKNFKKFFS